MQRDILTRLRSRKFLMAIANALFIFINEVMGQPIDPDAYWNITAGVLAFIAIEGYIDAKK